MQKLEILSFQQNPKGHQALLIFISISIWTEVSVRGLLAVASFTFYPLTIGPCIDTSAQIADVLILMLDVNGLTTPSPRLSFDIICDDHISLIAKGGGTLTNRAFPVPEIIHINDQICRKWITSSIYPVPLNLGGTKAPSFV